MVDILLQAKSLYCERDRRILFENLDVTLSAGEVMQVEGANGAGKTTLLRVLAGLSGAYEGTLYWREQPLSEVRQTFNDELLYLGHNAGVKQSLTPEENLRWYGALSGLREGISIDQALTKVGLQGYEDVPCHQLSAGQQRRVNLARLYLIPALLWILDEPFTSIDKVGVASLESLMESHVQEGGAVIITSHQPVSLQRDVTQLVLG